MKKKKFYCTHDGCLILIHALNDLRNRRIAEGKCIDTVNDENLRQDRTQGVGLVCCYK